VKVLAVPRKEDCTRLDRKIRRHRARPYTSALRPAATCGMHEPGSFPGGGSLCPGPRRVHGTPTIGSPNG
jgi:hypothetical protein